MFAGKQYRNSRTVKVEKAVCSSCLVSLMHAKEGGNLVLAEVREFLHSVKTRRLKRAEMQSIFSQFFHIFFISLMAVTLHLKTLKRKSSVWKEISVRKFFHINLQLLWFRSTTFWCSETSFYIVNHTAIAWGVPQSPLSSRKGTHHSLHLVSCSNSRIGSPRPAAWTVGAAGVSAVWGGVVRPWIWSFSAYMIQE